MPESQTRAGCAIEVAEAYLAHQKLSEKAQERNIEFDMNGAKKRRDAKRRLTRAVNRYQILKERNGAS